MCAAVVLGSYRVSFGFSIRNLTKALRTMASLMYLGLFWWIHRMISLACAAGSPPASTKLQTSSMLQMSGTPSLLHSFRKGLSFVTHVHLWSLASIKHKRSWKDSGPLLPVVANISCSRDGSTRVMPSSKQSFSLISFTSLKTGVAK